MIAEHLWQIYLQAYFQPCDFHNTSRPQRIFKMSELGGGIISVWNPRGEKYTLQKNRIFAKKARSRLANHGARYELLWGGNKSMRYKELSVYVPCSLREAAKIALQNQQLAFYYIDQRGALWLVSTGDTSIKQKVCKHICLRLLSSYLPVKNLALR